MSIGTASACERRPFSIIGRFRLLSMRPFTLILRTIHRIRRTFGLRDCPNSRRRRREDAPAAAPRRAPASNPPVVLQAPRARRPRRAIAAASWVLIDTLSGQTLGAANPDERRDPASLTKLMTAYVAFGALRAKTITPSQMVHGIAARVEGRGLAHVHRAAQGRQRRRAAARRDRPVGQRRVDRACRSSSRAREDAFVERMNAGSGAARSSRPRTSPTRPDCPNPQHYSTAADIARLAAALIRDYPEYYPLYSQKEFRYNNITQPNRNRLAVDRPVRRRREDRPHRRGGLVPRRIGEARRSPARLASCSARAPIQRAPPRARSS